ncbi:hypothetical protein [Actinoplanes sp. NPDC051411]|uniref:hypothetical protein n=1 Tax=Actinoplanes sp. NPDC051411 TaxID=3155522 RepID=UPI0034141A18
MDGWTIFFLVVNAAWVITCLVLAVRAGRRWRGMWLAEAVAFTGLFGLVWLANPAMSLGVVSIFIPDAGFAAFALWFAVGVGRDGAWFGWAVAAVVLTWGILVVGVALGHSDRQQGITDRDRDTKVLGGQQVDLAQNHVPILWVDHPPAVADAGVPASAGPTAEKIERSVFGPGTLTMVVNAAAGCEAAAVVAEERATTLDVMVVFERSPFLSPLPSPPADDFCKATTPGIFTSSTVAVQIDLPGTTTATTVVDAS